MQRTILFIIFILSHSLCYANSTEFKNIIFNFEDNSGVISFDSGKMISKGSTINFKSTQMNVFNTQDSIEFENSEMSALFNFTGKNIFNATSFLSAQNTNISFSDEKLQGSANEIGFELGDGLQRFSGISHTCSFSKEQDKIKTCLLNLTTTVDNIEINPASFKTVNMIVPSSFKMLSKKAKSIRFENFSLKTAKGGFVTEFKLKILLKFKVFVSGSIVDELNEKNRLGLTIDKAKFSIFNITYLLLKAIEWAKIKNTKVEGNTVFLTLK